MLEAPLIIVDAPGSWRLVPRKATRRELSSARVAVFDWRAGSNASVDAAEASVAGLSTDRGHYVFH